MQGVSALYNPYVNVRWANLRASFKLVDLTAAQEAMASASEAAEISQLGQTHDEIHAMSQKWATLENQGWPLDGTMQILPDDISGHQTGWWSDSISNEEGDFITPPVLTFDFTSNHSSVGFTVIFDNKANWFPAEFIISVYGAGDILLNTQRVDVTSPKQIVDMPTENYRKVIIEITKTRLPFQGVRIAEVVFGIVQEFDRHNITSGKILYEIEPAAKYLPSNELNIVFDNTDRKYNLINPSGLYAYLQQAQPLDVELGVGHSLGKLEYVNMGRFYFTKAEAQDSSMTAQIIAHDLFYPLSRSICRIGESGIWTVAQGVSAIIDDSGLNIIAEIPTDIGNRPVNKCIPQDTSHREALRLIAQAAMATCFFNRDGKLVFVELAEGLPVDVLNNRRLYDVAKISVRERINTVEVEVRNEYAETEFFYTASNLTEGESAQVLSINNPLVAPTNGNAVSAWLLAMEQKRLIYDLQERGNPAREITDTITVYDAYGENRNAVVIKEEYEFDGALSAETKGWG